MPPLLLFLFIAFAIVLGIGVLLAIVLPKGRSSAEPRPALPRREEDSGADGERFMASVLSSFICSEHDHLMNGVILYNPKNGASCEIDHILIFSRGIFVIETKNRAGDIYGDGTREEWRQVLADGNIVHSMRSPVLQNATHVRFVKEILFRKLRTSIPVKGYVVFVRGNIRHIDSPDVCTPFTLGRILGEYPERLSPAERDRAYRALRAHLEKYPVTKEEHLRYIRSRHPDEP